MFLGQCSLVKQGVNAFGSNCLSVCVHGYFFRALLVVLHVAVNIRDFPCGLQQKTSTDAFSDTGEHYQPEVFFCLSVCNYEACVDGLYGHV